MRSKIFDAAKEVVVKLRQAGHRAFCVGGCARDMIIGVAPAEYDVTTSATPKEISQIFPNTVPIGVSFGVVLVILDDPSASLGHRYKFEVATFRRDHGYSDGRRPDLVTYSDNEKEDVLRRDFTINGMLYDPVKEELIDYVNGIEDVGNRVLRTIGDPNERFTEDKLRMMRAVRFGARYKFSIEKDAFEAIKELAPQIRQVSKERVRDELVKIVTQANPGFGLELLRQSGVLAYILPEANKMSGVEQPPEFHPEGDVFVHTCLVLDKLHENAGGDVSPELAVGGLLHDVGKPPTFSVSDRIRFNGHDRVGAEMSKRIMRELKFPNKQIDVVHSLVREHLKFKDVFKMRKSTLKRFIGMPHFEDHLALHLADCLASHGITDAHSFALKALSELKEDEIKPKPLLSGKDLINMGYSPGPIFSDILSLVEEGQLEGEIKTKSEAERIVVETHPLGKSEKGEEALPE